MKKKTILALIGCISVWTISSCEDIIDVDLRTAEPQIHFRDPAGEENQ